MKKILCGLVLSVGLIGCAPSAKNIQASYVSPLQYEDYSCRQIRAELARVTRKVHEVSGVQDDHASKDSAALGVGLVLFWPALFFMPGEDRAEELSRLKGEYEAIEQVAIKKDCDVADEIAEAKKLSDQREAEKKQYQKEMGQTNE